MTAAVEPSVQPKKKPGRKPKASVPPTTDTAENSPIVNGGESVEQRRARLLAELADLSPQNAGPLGPNYWAMSHSALKALCISKGIVDRTGAIEGMVTSLQADDMNNGVQPHPRENENVMSGIQAGRTPVHAEPHTRDAVRIIDADGNEYAVVKRIGKMVNGNPILLDMQGNAKKIVAALNEGRFA